MTGTATLSKVLTIRENEKKVAQKAYHQSMGVFEEVAKELYLLLKKKEEAEQQYERFIQSTAPINQIKQLVDYLEVLTTEILFVQQKVEVARNDMEKKQVKLSDSYVEVKKFEKIIDIRKQDERDELKRKEDAFMNEISMNQFLSHKNR
ncbi:flagellar export protein FliJ [Oceanobacillus bengalensis]|uniref:Flagellar FliJ protein n=1 Tax=Oceanobacillus bengalensis TaxID=1435466 RepID=A0A494Z5U8_9BACI|nr:flagellar export protein FliJ [Oceanobacillus bengalensis]RKQ17371.1 flagellar export protein FliJ [Oceanobacillus bengalensis]